MSNPWFLAALAGIIGWFHIELLAQLLNLSRLGAPLPAAFDGMVTDEDRERTKEYHAATAKLGVLESAVMLALTLGFWWAGGFAWLDASLRGLGYGPIIGGLILFSVLGLAKMSASLPFEWWSTFKIEAAFGFNRTTPATFVSDRIKGLLLGAAIGLPLLALVLWFFQSFQLAALWAWVATSVFGILMGWLSPRLIMPLFLKFTPMQDGPLRAAIMALAAKLNFPVADIAVVDGSRRSTKANAFFTGFGRTRRIALFDTLIDRHPQGEIVSVLAHEIGHAKLGHVPRQIALGIAVSGVMFLLLHIALQDARLFAAFGVQHSSTAMSMVLFMLVYQPWSALLDMLANAISRKHEFQADAFAREFAGGPQPMVAALKRLSVEHLAHLTPHPFYVRLHYSHPPVAERVQALLAS